LSKGEKRTEEEFDLPRMMEDLTLLLIHLSSWREKGSADLGAVMSWKGYDFGVLDRLAQKGYISDSKRAKSLYLTDRGTKEAERLQDDYLRAMGEAYRQDTVASSATSKARDEVEFFCEVCRAHVNVPSGYEPFARYVEGKMSLAHITELLRRYHVRHWHTDAVKMSRDRFAYNLRNGMDFEDAANEAREYARKMVPGESLPPAGKG
jgi:uncharacterized protein DUF6429